MNAAHQLMTKRVVIVRIYSCVACSSLE